MWPGRPGTGRRSVTLVPQASHQAPSPQVPQSPAHAHRNSGSRTAPGKAEWMVSGRVTSPPDRARMVSGEASRIRTEEIRSGSCGALGGVGIVFSGGW